jgi:hypothetical protein
MNNCYPCLDVIATLNQLSNQYKIIGLVPEEEMLIEEELRKMTGALFELKSSERYKRYLPNYAPSLFGINQKGEIFFILPGVPGENAYLRQFLESFLRKASPLLEETWQL